MKHPAAFKHTLVRLHSASHIQRRISHFHFAFIVISGCFAVLILQHPIISLFLCSASWMCLCRFLSSSTSLDNVLVTFYSDPPRHSTQGCFPPRLSNLLFSSWIWLLFLCTYRPSSFPPTQSAVCCCKDYHYCYYSDNIFSIYASFAVSCKAVVVLTWCDRQCGDTNTANACPHHFRSITDNWRCDCTSVTNDIAAVGETVFGI